MVQDDKPVGLEGLEVAFDDERVVSDAGVMLVATLAGRHGGCVNPPTGYERRLLSGGEHEVRRNGGRGKHQLRAGRLCIWAASPTRYLTAPATCPVAP